MKKIFALILFATMCMSVPSEVCAKAEKPQNPSPIHYKLVGDTYIIRLDKGQEIITTLRQFCVDHKIQAASIQGIGAGENLNIGFFNTKTKQYEVKNIKDCVEITSLLGNVTVKENAPFIHLHITTSDSFHSVSGGHLLSGEIALTGEIFVKPLNTKLKRNYIPDLGISIFEME